MKNVSDRKYRTDEQTEIQFENLTMKIYIVQLNYIFPGSSKKYF